MLRRSRPLRGVVFESRPVIEGKACPTLTSALTVPLEPRLTAAPQADGVRLTWQADALYGENALIARGPDDSDLHTLAAADGGAYLDATAARGTAYVYAIEMQSTNLIALSAPVTAQTLPP